MPKMSRVQILESQVRELTAQLAAATDILTELRAMDDERNCPYCAKDDWGEDKHEPTCIYARIYRFLDTPRVDMQILLDLKAAVVDVCLALVRMGGERNQVEKRLERLMTMVGLEPDQVELHCHPPETHPVREAPPYNYSVELRMGAQP
jgi:hypothetical protein